MMEPRRPGSVLQVFDYFLALGTPRNLDAWLEPIIALDASSVCYYTAAIR